MKRVFLCASLCIAINLCATNPNQEHSIRFTENKGQWNEDILYRLRFNTGAMFAEKNRLTFNFLAVNDLEKIHDYYHVHDSSPVEENFPIHGHAWRINFKNANSNVETTGGQGYPFYENHFRGNDPSKWASDVKVYQEVRYQNLYNGIDLLLSEKQGKLEYSFILQAGALPSNILLNYEGLENIYLQDGQLHYSTSVNDIYEEKPYSFQEINGQKIEVATRLVLNGTTVHFEFPNGYNPNYPLVIDPVFVFGTFTGSFADNFGYTATYDNNGNFYAGGIARGAGYPTTPGAFQLNFAGGLIIGADFDQGYDADISITKYNPTGTALIYSTYLGGAVNEQPHSIIVNSNNELLIYGRSNSTNYPVTAGAYDVALNGTAMDIVVTKFNATGTALLGSTYVGGSGDDGVNIEMSPRAISSLKFNYADDARGDIQIDAQGNVYVASCTRSTDFPVTAGVFKTTLTGLQDGCVFKMNSSLTSLTWSSYIGGNGDDAAYSLALDNTGTLYVCGGTSSTNFPTSAGVPFPTFRGGLADGFVAHINSTATAILQSSYIGTVAYDQSYFVQLDGSNNVYLLGQTSGAFPVTGGVYSNPNSGQFIISLTPNLNTINFSTVYGNGLGRPVLSPTAFLVDNCRNIYTSGWGGLVNTSVNSGTGVMSGLPLTSDALQTASDFSDFYFMVLSPNAGSLVYGSYFGGPFSAEHVDGGTSRFDKNGVIYQAVCAGCGANSDFPSFPGVWSQTNNSFNCNLGSAKIEFQIIGVDVDIEANPDTSGCSPFTVNFRATGTNAKEWFWDLGDGTFSTDSVLTKTYSTPGTYSVKLIGLDSTTCDGLFFADTASASIIVFANPIANAGQDQQICDGTSATLTALGGTSYLWNTNQTTQSITVSPLVNTEYRVTVTDANGCVDADSVAVSVRNNFVTNVDEQICQGESIFVGGGFQTSAGIYVDSLTTQDGCDSVIITTLTVLPVPTSNIDKSICQGESYFVGGANQTSTGIYFDTLTTQAGCDSIIITNLSVVPVPVTNVDVSICDGETYFAGGTNQTSAGIYFDTLTTQASCDSIIITNLSVLPVPVTNVAVSICDGESYFAGGANQTSTGIYFDTLTTQDGCDSIIITNLTVLPVPVTNVDVSICEGETHFAGGGNQTSSGIYFDTLTTQDGCDSIVITNLTVLPVPVTNVDVSICDGENHFTGGANQISAGIYFDTLTTQTGCDSIIITSLTVLPVPVTNVDVSICDGESHFADGANQTSAGIYFDTLTTQEGCDSIVITNLTVLPVPVANVDVSICDGESHFAGGANQTSSGIYFDTLTTQDGCDSIIITALTVLPNSSSQQIINICSGDSALAGGSYQTQSGNYFDTLVAANGCDSIIATQLNISVLGLTFDVKNVSCNCGTSGTPPNPNQFCTLNFSGLPHGTILSEQYAADGIHISGNANGSFPDKVIVFNSNLSGTPDPDLEVDLGNLAIFPTTVTDNNGNGLVDSPNDQGDGGKMTFTFDTERTVYSLVFVDNEVSGGTIKAFGATNNLIVSVNIPASSNASVQTININASGVRRLEINYHDSGGVTEIKLSCPQPTCSIDLDSLAHGTLVNNQFAADGIHISGTGFSTNPDQVIIFNSNLNGTPDPDLEVNVGNLLILPEDITDNNGDGLVDAPNDDSDGGTIIFTFDSDRTVYSFTFVDNDRNNGTVRAYDALNNLIATVSTPSSSNPIQVIALNIAGVRRLEISFRDSRGITDLRISCNEICCDGSVTAIPIGGFPPYQYLWEDGSTTASLDSLCEGTHFVIVTDSLGCVVSDSVTIGKDPAFYTNVSVEICEGDSVLAGGSYQTEAGLYYDTTGAIGNCPEVLVTEVIVLPAATSTQQVVICDGESFFAGGANQTVSGNYFDTLSTAAGCDSVVITELTVLSNAATTLQVEICNSESYFAEGANQTSPGIYFDTLVSANGCDSVVTTELTVLPNTATTLQVEICEGETHFAGGDFQTESGTYFDTFASANGCDSVVTTELTIKSNSVTFIQVEICTSDTTLLGVTPDSICALLDCCCCCPWHIPQTVLQTDTFQTSQGCDSIVTIETTYFPIYNKTLPFSICEGDSFFAGGAFQTQSGVYTDSFTIEGGCDSIVTIELTVKPVYQLTEQVSICEGDSFFVGGAFQTQTGTYVDLLLTESGCDSVITTELTVNPSSVVNQSVNICDGESYFAAGDFKTTSGIYFDTLTNSGGCDSIVITELTVLPEPAIITFESICEGDSVFASGTWQTASGIYSDTLQTTNGCDSISSVSLTVFPVDTIVQQISICQGDSFLVGGVFQTASGSYFDALLSSNACDSIIQTELTVSPQLNLSAAATNASCFGGNDGEIDLSVSGGTAPYIVVWNNAQTAEDITGLVAGQYSVAVTDFIGCSGTTSANITQPAPLALGATSIPASCAGEDDGSIDLLVLGGTPPYNYEWTTGSTDEDINTETAGQYLVTVTDNNGCNATLITFIQEPQEITLSGNVTNVSTPGGSDGAINLSVGGGTSPYTYIWSNGATTQDLINLQVGTYSVTVTDANGCEAVGSFVVANTSRTLPKGKDFVALRVYPNPVKRQFYVSFFSMDNGDAEIKLFDITGRNILGQRIDVQKGNNKKYLQVPPQIPPGIYMLEFKMGEVIKMVKVIAE